MSRTFRFGLVTRVDADYVYVWSTAHRLTEAIIPRSEADIQPGDVVNYQQSNSLSMVQNDSRIARVTKHDLTVLYHPKETHYFRIRTTLMIPETKDKQSKQIIRSGPYAGQCVEFFAFSVEFGKVASFVKMECSPRKVYRGYINRIPIDIDPNELDTMFALVNLDLKEVTNHFEIAEAKKRSPWHDDAAISASGMLLSQISPADDQFTRDDVFSKPATSNIGQANGSHLLPPRFATAGPVIGARAVDPSNYPPAASRQSATAAGQPSINLDVFGPNVTSPLDTGTSQSVGSARRNDDFDLFDTAVPQASVVTSGGDGDLDEFASMIPQPPKKSSGIVSDFDAFDPFGSSGKPSTGANPTIIAEKSRNAVYNRDVDTFGPTDPFEVSHRMASSKDRNTASVHFEEDLDLERLPSDKQRMPMAGMKIVQPEIVVTMENFVRAKRFIREAWAAMENGDDARSAVLNMHKALAILQ